MIGFYLSLALLTLSLAAFGVCAVIAHAADSADDAALGIAREGGDPR